MYGFADGDPVNFSDPFGLCPTCDLVVKAIQSKVNPTGGAVRGCDVGWGCGGYGASRDGGRRTHAGVDYTGTANQDVKAVISGTVRVGQPYADGTDSEVLRLVEITSFDGSEVVKQMYVGPAAGVQTGSVVIAGQKLGVLQSLQGRYRGITDHGHVEVRRNGAVVNPTTVIP